MGASKPQPGEIIGSYRLETLIGKGGMGSVFKASHVKLGRKVALKILADHLAADDKFLSRFFHEAKVVNEIHHPNIIDVVDFLEFDEPRRVAYVMELIEGPSLRRLLRQQRLTMAQSLNIGLQLASAIEAVHSIKVVHRDLKPDNILITAPVDSDMSVVPAIKILDFGIAKLFDRDNVFETATGQVVGTPVYMAPEQIAAGPVSPATDVYAIGEILYEMGTGARAFPRDRMKALRMKLAPVPPDLATPNWPIGEDFRSLVRSCLEPNPEARPSLPQIRSRIRTMQESAERVAYAFATPTPAPGGYVPPEPERRSDSSTRAERWPEADERSSPGPLETGERSAAGPLETHPERPLATLDPIHSAVAARVSPGMLIAASSILLVVMLGLGYILLATEEETQVLVPEVPTARSDPTAGAPATAQPARAPAPPRQPLISPDPPPSAEPQPSPATAVAEAAPKEAVAATPAPRERKKTRSRRTRRAKKKARAPPSTPAVVALDTKPSGAEVFDAASGRRLGETPLEVEITSGRRRKVRIELDGFQTLEAVLRDGPARRLTLVKGKNSLVKKKTLLPW